MIRNSPTAATHRRPKKAALAALLAAALLAAGWWAWSGRAAPVQRPLEVIISGDTAGWIVPCGCTSNQSGGLPRRGTLAAQTGQGADLLLLDAGGAARGTSPYDVARFSAILRGERLMGIHAHNIGAAEAELGTETLSRLRTETGVPLFSTNATDATGRGVGEPALVVSAGGHRVAVLGVLSPALAPSGWRVTSPQTAVPQALADLRGKYDVAIVLAYLPDEELQRLAAELPEVDIVAGGPTGQSISPRQLGPTMLVSATNKGKFVARLSASRGGAGWSGQIVELNASFADDPRQQENVQAFRRELADRDFAASETSFIDPLSASAETEQSLAGSARCIECHSDCAAAWQGSGHAHAGASLQDSAADSQCQQCHTDGYGLPGGFVSARRSANLALVGCESCHGPSAQHAAQPKQPTAYVGRAPDQCLRCHDSENSPAFSYAQYWPRIEHTLEAAPSEPVP
ncbi:MAG: multiheme c-type cytochrome [Pirellulales bacterium]